MRLVGNNIKRLDTTAFVGLKQLKELHLNENQQTFNNGEPVSQDEFKQLLKNVTNKRRIFFRIDSKDFDKKSLKIPI